MALHLCRSGVVLSECYGVDGPDEDLGFRRCVYSCKMTVFRVPGD